MKRSKKTLCIFLAIITLAVFALALSSCGGNEDADKPVISYAEDFELELSDDGSYYKVVGTAYRIKNYTVPDEYNGIPIKEIADDAFLGHTGIERITISDSVTTIGNNAFKNCISLKNISFGGVTTIKEYAFEGCTALTEVVIGENVTSIGDYAFSSCTNLTSFSLPSTLEFFGWRVFYESAVEYNDYDNAKYLGNEENPYMILCAASDTIIESCTINENTKFISGRAFQKCANLNEITIPSSVRSIGNYAFAQCTELTTVNISEQVELIGEYAFSGCEKLTDANIPVSLEKIPAGMFYGCALLERAIIPNDVTEIGESAFSGCILVKSVSIPRGVTKINDMTFSACISLTDVVFLGNVTEIGANAFDSCIMLQTVSFPDSLKKIGDYAFNLCASMEKVILPDGVTEIGEYAFFGCISVAEVSIPDSLEKLGSWGLIMGDKMNYKTEEGNCYIGNENNPYLVLLGADDDTTTACLTKPGTKFISDLAFAECTSIRKVTISESVISIASDAFGGCTGIDELHIESFKAWMNVSFGTEYSNPMLYAKKLYLKGALMTEFNVPDGVTELKPYVFSSYGGALQSIILANTVEKIDANAFKYCNVDSLVINCKMDKLEEGTIKNCTRATSLTINGVKTIATETLLYNSAVHNLTLGNGVETIEKKAFKGSDLKHVIITDSVTTIGEYAFSYCDMIEQLELGNGITSVGVRAFEQCDSLTSVTLPDSLEVIPNGMFSGCSKLTTVAFGENTTVIGYEAFTYCPIEKITLPAKVVTIDAYAFNHCDKLREIALNDALVTIGYQAFHQCWNLERIIIPDSVTSIGHEAFDDCSSLKSVEFGKGLTEIGYEAFYGCKAIESIVLPENLEYISSGTFRQCENLKTVQCGNKINSIGGHAFAECYALEEFVVPNSVKTIESDVFSACRNLKKITLGNSIETISEYAFRYCSIEDIYFNGTEEEWKEIKVTDLVLPSTVTIHFLKD